MKEGWEAVIGMEVHAQLATATKIFCGCRVEFGGEPNSNTCPVCSGLPGALPVLNERVVELGARAALSLGLEIQETSVFARERIIFILTCQRVTRSRSTTSRSRPTAS